MQTNEDSLPDNRPPVDELAVNGLPGEQELSPLKRVVDSWEAEAEALERQRELAWQVGRQVSIEPEPSIISTEHPSNSAGLVHSSGFSLVAPEQPAADPSGSGDSVVANQVAGILVPGPSAPEHSAPENAASDSAENLPAVAMDRAASELSKPNDIRTSAVMVSDAQPHQLAYSTFLSLLVVLVLIITIRFTVPPLVESLRYSWHRGELRAEYEVSGQRLQNVSLNSLSEASELVSRRVGPSVVHINLLNPTRRLLFESESLEMMGQGSGIILDTDGHILTNHHVIEDAGRIEVALSDGRRVVATELGRDPFTDLAVIKINASGLMPAEWGDSNRMDVGSPVWAVGSPFGLERTVTFGILSGKHRIDLKGAPRWDMRDSKATMYGDLMQSDVAVNPGNSGGPLVNSAGKIVGINTAIVGETYIGISFAIPSNVARRVAEGLIKEGDVPRGWLGVDFGNPDFDGPWEEVSAPRGALVDQWATTGNSPAKAAGIRPGDLIVKFGDKEVPNYRMLMSWVAQTDVGSIVPIEVVRDGQSLVFQVEISRRPGLPSDPR